MPDNENKLATIEPEMREETFLQDIADGTQTLTPAVRKEEYLRRIAARIWGINDRNTAQDHSLYQLSSALSPHVNGLILVSTAVNGETGIVWRPLRPENVEPLYDDTGAIWALTSQNGVVNWREMSPAMFVVKFSQGFYTDLTSVISSAINDLVTSGSSSAVMSTDYDPQDSADDDVEVWENLIEAIGRPIYFDDQINFQIIPASIDRTANFDDPRLVCAFPALEVSSGFYVRLSFIFRYIPDPSSYPVFRQTCIAERIYPGITPTT